MNSVQKKSRFSTFLIVVSIIAVGAAIAVLFVVTKPSTKRIKPPVSSPLVSTFVAVRDTAKLTVEALGTVKAEQETIVRVRVSGQVEELAPNFTVGGLLQTGDLLLRLDASDYENALALKESVLAKAEADYSLEMGQQRVARTEIAQLNKTAPNSIKNTSLALREPQLAQAKAALESAQVEVQQAKLDLERTTVMAPYNAIVIERNVSLGSQASLSDSVATLVGTDTYYVEASIPLDKLKGLGLDVFNDTTAQIFTTTGTEREGRVRHSIATLDATTRMGRVLIDVRDPLALSSDLSELILGDQVRVLLQAGSLPNVIVLPRSALRDNDHVWVAKKHDNDSFSLDLRPVDVLWKDTSVALIDKGIEAGEHIISSPLGAPIQGMPVRIAQPKKGKENTTPKDGQKSEGTPGKKNPKGALDATAKPQKAE